MPRSGRKHKTSRLAQRELIGRVARVVASNHPPFLDVEGRVVDETYATLVLDVDGREVVVPKRGQSFAFTLDDGVVETLEGSLLEHHPEDRIKR